MEVNEVMSQLEDFGNDQTKKTYMTHGAKEPVFGVKVQDLKKIVKKVKKNHDLSLALYATGNSDAMYLAGLIADEKQITKAQLNTWVGQAYWQYLNEYAVAWVAAETPFGFELAKEWIENESELIQAAGWNTLMSIAGMKADEELDINFYKEKLKYIGDNIHKAKNRVRYTMNGFVIGIGGSIQALNKDAKEVATKIGKVSVEMNGTACKVPLAIDYIKKIEARNSVGKKRKSARC